MVQHQAKHSTGPRHGGKGPHVVAMRQGEGGFDKTVAKLAKEAAHRKLPSIYQQIPCVREMKRIAEIAESAGDEETAGAVRLALGELAAEATV